jgi:hypothetical protein
MTQMDALKNLFILKQKNSPEFGMGYKNIEKLLTV